MHDTYEWKWPKKQQQQQQNAFNYSHPQTLQKTARNATSPRGGEYYDAHNDNGVITTRGEQNTQKTSDSALSRAEGLDSYWFLLFLKEGRNRKQHHGAHRAGGSLLDGAVQGRSAGLGWNKNIK